jgi:hypothetical protein
VRSGIVGPSYQSQSLLADAQMCKNWYVETIESGSGKSKMALYRSPGLKRFTDPKGYGLGGYGLGGYGIGEEAQKVWNMKSCFGRTFAVVEWPKEQNLIEVFSDGTFISRGTLGAPGTKPSIAYNNASQLMIASGGQLFLLNLTNNQLSEIDTTKGTALQGPVSKIRFSDSFFIALIKNSQKFQVSAPLDGSSWDPTDITAIEVFPDNVLSMEVDHREIILMGEKQTVIYGDSGAPNFPFDPVPGGFMEQGILAPESLVKADNSWFWIGQDERGGAMAWRAVGYSPRRITTHAIEFAWQGYPRVDDAIAWTFQYRGHTFIHFYFPSADKSWRFDIAENLWHEVGSSIGAHLGLCHLFAYGKHLVGARNSGIIYELGTFTDDDGAPLIVTRRSPYIGDEDEWGFHTELRLSVETGVGPSPPLLDGRGQPRDPILSLRWSDDGAKTWSQPRNVGLGKGGEYGKRVVFRRLGRSRHRIYEIQCSDSVPVNIIDAYLSVENAQGAYA